MFGASWANTQYFNPKQVGGLKLWLDATDPAANGTQPANLSSVSTWVDKSGVGNNLVQAVGANQPTYRTNILNSKPTVRFNSVNSFMQKTSASSLGTQLTVFVVGTTSGNGTNRGSFFDYSTNVTTNTGMNLLNEATPTIVGGFFDGGLKQAISAAIVLPYTAVLYAYNNGTNAFVFSNGTQIATVACGNVSGSPNVYTIGALFGPLANYYLNGDIAEIVAYNGNISAAQKLLVNRYLGNKWGIAVA